MNPSPCCPARPLRRLHRRADGNAFIVAVVFIAIFSVIAGAAYVLSDETNRRTARENQFVSSQTAADAALDVMYGRFSHWVVGHTGVTPSIKDGGTVGYSGNASFPAITGAISFANLPGLSGFTVSNVTLTPLLPDDTQDVASKPTFPDAGVAKSDPKGYQNTINKWYVNIANLYQPETFSNTLAYLASVTISPVQADALHPNPITVTRYFQSSQVSPFAYNIFTEGTFEDYDFGQSFDSEANIYASTKIQLDHKGTIINGPMRYGGSFVAPGGATDLGSVLAFQDPNTGANVDPYTSGLLRQVSKIEVVPGIQNVIAHNSDGSRTSGLENAAASADAFSRRELIEPPANLGADTAPDQIGQRRIYTQADVRLKVSVGSKTVTVGTVTTTVPVATGTFYDPKGNVVGQYSGTIVSPTVTTWVPTSGGTTTTAGVISAVTVNPATSTTPFYDATRRYDTTGNYTGLPGQPTTGNTGNGVESVDVNVGTLATAINSNQSSFANNIVYVWDDGGSGQKNGVRLWNGGVLPSNGLTVGSTDPVYIKGDYNTGTVLTNPADINSAPLAATLPVADVTGWNNGTMASASDRALPTYTARPSGVFGDSVTTLSQSWRDANSGSTQYATSTTYNTVMGFGSGDNNSLLPDDSFSNGNYAFVNSLEMWNNARWNQLGEQMSLYHSIYNLHRNAPSWLNGGWVIIQNDFDAATARLPLKWGYLVFSRGRYTRN